MLLYITYPLLVFYLSSNPYFKRGFRFLVGYRFPGLLFRVLLFILGITVFSRLAFFIWSICFSSIFPLIRTLYILQLILSRIFPCCHFCFDPYLLTITWSFGIRYVMLNCFYEGLNWLLM